MRKLNAALAAMISLAVAAPSLASPQLSERERQRAIELARIQAKADAAERAEERLKSLSARKHSCEMKRWTWDHANESCAPSKYFTRPKPE